jgi:hypothetical protein
MPSLLAFPVVSLQYFLERFPFFEFGTAKVNYCFDITMHSLLYFSLPAENNLIKHSKLSIYT